jgi:hypothetical protein
MECDWEVEIAPDAPVIDAAWDGHVDLRRTPGRIKEICETAQFPALHDALIQLNSPASPVWTVKCDVWIPESFDADEMDADPETAISGLACYIDLIPIDNRTCSTLDAVVDWCRCLTLNLRTRPSRQCRVDAIVRRACTATNVEGLGVTAYVSACGASPRDASRALSVALATLADSIQALGASGRQASKYNRNIVGE